MIDVRSVDNHTVLSDASLLVLWVCVVPINLRPEHHIELLCLWWIDIHMWPHHRSVICDKCSTRSADKPVHARAPSGYLHCQQSSRNSVSVSYSTGAFFGFIIQGRCNVRTACLPSRKHELTTLYKASHFTLAEVKRHSAERRV